MRPSASTGGRVHTMTDRQCPPPTRAYRVLRLVRTALGVVVAALTLLRLLGWL